MSKGISKEQLYYLYEKYLSNQCTYQEILQLLHYFEVEDETSILNIIQRELNSDNDKSVAAGKESIRLLEIFKNVQKAKSANDGSRHNIRRLIYRFSIAAMVALLIGGAVLWRLFVYSPHTESIHEAPVAKTNLPDKIVPGHSGAVLHLANGSIIVLDSAQNGALAKQNNVQVVKEGGQIKYLGDATKTEYNTITTDKGREWKIVLPDGTKVWLNAATTLRFPISFDKLALREVNLDGEAYFEVEKNDEKPFIVHTARQDIKDLGTRFNVSCYADDPFTKTTLLEGIVEINAKKILKPGEQAITTEDNDLKVITTTADAAISWKNGYLSFNDDNIYDIMRKLARWYNVEVVYEGKVSTESMEGSMSRFDDVSKVLDIIQKAGPFRFTIRQRTIYVTGTID